MEDKELDFALRYPFTDVARKAIASTELTESIAYLAVERIRRSLEGDMRALVSFRGSDKEEAIASFAASRMILGYLRNSFLTSRFAVNEAKIAHGWLDKADEKEVDAVAAIFGILTTPTKEKGRMLITLPIYLRYSPRSVDYRITNRRLVSGMVEITYHEKKRLAEEAVKKHVERIPLVKDPPELIKNAAEKLLESLPKTQPGMSGNALASGAKVEDHPPCVEKLMESMRKHENLNHQARYFLATYLMAIGMNDEGIVQLFSDAPDFKERTTKYQVAQIRKRAYSVPSCATTLTYGLCCAVCRIGSPLNWHTLGKERKGYIKQQVIGSSGSVMMATTENKKEGAVIDEGDAKSVEEADT